MSSAGFDNIYLVDLRNHGRSFHDNEMSMALMCEDVCRLHSKIFGDDRPAFYIGHSLVRQLLLFFILCTARVPLNLNLSYEYLIMVLSRFSQYEIEAVT